MILREAPRSLSGLELAAKLACMEAPWLVPLSDLVVDDEIVEAADSVLQSGWWSMGPRVQAFEQEFAALCGVQHALAVANGTAALHLAFVALGCGPGDEVVLPSLTFVAAANTIARTGATPVLCDVCGPDDLNLDPADVEAAISSRTKAIAVLHYGGYPCDMDAITSIADAHGLSVVEDAAHAPGASWKGRPCGSLSAVGCFSFFSNKNLPIGEGGMVVTNDAALAERLRLLRSHGMTTLTWDRARGHASAYDVVIEGFNYRLDEVRAAIGLVQLRRLSAGNAARAGHHARYREALDGSAGITMPFRAFPEESSSHHLAVVLLPEGVDRARVQNRLREERIQTSVHYPPIHRFKAYRDGGATRRLPRTDNVAERILSLPLFPHMTKDQVDLVVDKLLAAV